MHRLITRTEALGRRNSLRLDAVADYFSEPASVQELLEVDRELHALAIPFFMLGGGTNVFFDRPRYPGCVISTRRLTWLSRDSQATLLHCQAGVPLTRAIRLAMTSGWSGLESFIGIPGTVGGATYGNAGGCGIGIGELVERIRVIGSDGRLRWLAGREIDWQYRSSGLGATMVTDIVLRLMAGDRDRVRRTTCRYLARKRDTQPLSAASAGCVFTNPEGDSAGRLIELAGFKGAREGGACVSERHANFIINSGSATFEDVGRLIERIRERVRDRFGLDLVRELVTPTEFGCDRHAMRAVLGESDDDGRE